MCNCAGHSAHLNKQHMFVCLQYMVSTEEDTLVKPKAEQIYKHK